MRPFELTLHDDLKVVVNPRHIAYITSIVVGASSMTRILMSGVSDPIDVLEKYDDVSRWLGVVP